MSTYLHPAVAAVDVAGANLQLAASLVHQVFDLLHEEVVFLHAGKGGGRREGVGGLLENQCSLCLSPPQPVTVTPRETVGLMLIWLGTLPADKDIHWCQSVGCHDPRRYSERYRVGEDWGVGDTLGEASRNQELSTPWLPLFPPKYLTLEVILGVN